MPAIHRIGQEEIGRSRVIIRLTMIGSALSGNQHFNDFESVSQVVSGTFDDKLVSSKKLNDKIVSELKKVHIAAPVDMEDFSARDGTYVSERHSIHPAYPFRFSARDVARFGQLYLDEGRWSGRQVISASWVKASTTAYSSTDRGSMGYGYLWWTLNPDVFGPGAALASGYGGRLPSCRQRIWLSYRLLIRPKTPRASVRVVSPSCCSSSQPQRRDQY